MKKLISLFTIIICCSTLSSQNLFHKIIGDQNNSDLQDMKPTSDGGSIFIGKTNELGNEDILLTKLDSSSEVIWSNKYNFNAIDEGKGIAIDSNGDYIFVGETIDGVNNRDIISVKTDSTGNIIWSKQFGGINDEGVNKVITTADGGYLIIAHTMSYGNGAQDLYIIKLNSSGTLMWNSVIGGSAGDIPYSAIELSNNDIIITGLTSNGLGSADFLFVRLNSSGTLLSNKNIGSSEYEYGEEIILRNNGNGFAIIGSVNDPSTNNLNTLVLLTDSFGNPTLARSIGGKFYKNIGHNIFSVNDGYIITGSTQYSNKDILLYRMRDNGSVQWSKHYGTNDTEEAFTSFQRADRSILCGGVSNSFNQNSRNTYLVSVDSNGYSECYNKNYNFSLPQSLSFTTTSPILATDYTLNPPTTLSILETNHSSNNNTICPKTSFRKVTHDGKGSVGSKILKSYEGGYITSGSTRNWSTVPSFSLLNTDEEGNPLWMNTYLTSSQFDNMISTDMDYTNDNGYVTVGYFPYPQNGGIIIKTDSLGSIIWSKQYNGGNNVIFNGVRTLTNGDIIIIGSTTNASTGTGSTERMFVLKLSNSGNLIWERTYGHNNNGCVPRAIEVNNNNEIVFTGYVNGGIFSTNPNPFICKMDSSGNLQLFKIINLGTINLNISNDLALTYDKGVVLTGIDRNGGGPYLWAMKVDSSGNIAWSNKYIHNSSDFPGIAIAKGNSIIENSDKSISILGTATFNTWNYHQSYFLKLNSLGNVGTGHIFGGVGTDNGVDIVENFDRTNTLLVTSKNYREQGLLGGDFYRNLLIVKDDYCDETNLTTIQTQAITNTISDITPTIESNLNTFSTLSLTKQPLSPTLGSFDPYSWFSSSSTGLGDTVNFNGNVSSGDSFYWDFGDGTYDSTNFNPTHIYSTIANYQACLTVSSACGSNTYCDSTCTNAVLYSVYTTNPTPCLGDSTLLYVSTGTLNNAANWEWYSGSCGGTYIGSGDSINVYPQGNITYFARGEGGCTTPSICKSIIITSNTIDTTIIQSMNTLTSNSLGSTYRWLDCNNNFTHISGETNQSFTASTNGDYTIEITKNGCIDTSACINIASCIIDTSTTINLNSITVNLIGASYKWIDCNNGYVYILGETNQTFTALTSGNYTVEITLNGCIDTSSCINIDICNNNSNYIYTDNGNGNYSFTNTSTGNFNQTHWAFGDGNTSTLTNPNHTFTTNGTYVVVLAINDSTTASPCIDYFIDTVIVIGLSSTTPCVAGYAVYPDTINGGLIVVNSSTGSNLTYNWDFGDGNTSTLQNPSHTYTNSGPFNLCLIVNDGSGCTDMYCDSIGQNGVVFKGAAGFTINVISSNTTSIDKLSMDSDVKIYPNPTSNQLTIKSEKFSFNEITIVDVTGRTIQTIQKETNIVNVANLPTGIYFINLISDEKTVVNKFVKK